MCGRIKYMFVWSGYIYACDIVNEKYTNGVYVKKEIVVYVNFDVIISVHI